jgi:hypothetical protein
LGAAVLSQSVQERFPYQDGEGQCAHEKVAWSGRKKTDLPVTLWLSFDTAKCSCATMALQFTFANRCSMWTQKIRGASVAERTIIIL